MQKQILYLKENVKKNVIFSEIFQCKKRKKIKVHKRPLHWGEAIQRQSPENVLFYYNFNNRVLIA